MAQPQSFIGARISLTSVADIRYKGILMGINHAESTIQLSDVISMGTESRRPPAEFIPPSDTSYGTVVFRATEVKDLAIDPTPPAAGLFRDPAVLGAGPQPPGPYGGYVPQQPPYGQMPMGGPGPPNGHRGMNGPPPQHVPAGYPQPPQQQQRFVNAQEQQNAQAAAAVGKSPIPPTQPPAPNVVPQPAENSAAHPSQPGVSAAAPTRPSDPVRSASATLEKVERAMDELRTQPPPAASAGPAPHSGRGGRRGGRGGAGQSTGARVQVPDTEFDFEAMNAKFDKASLRPNESESDSESDDSEDRVPDELEKKEKPGKFYNPQRSFFDDISSDSNLKDGGNPRGRGRGRGGALGRQRREEERNRNLSTFGETGVGGGHNGFGFGGFPGGQGGPGGGGGRGRRRWGGGRGGGGGGRGRDATQRA
ncbi:hypothetical protein RhiJN_02830 [Ceratobasidium sp. AG-Ba]|nr:hypothetical protein RhiJN_02830 [Ceratobasidium sp. AG-Ba]